MRIYGISDLHLSISIIDKSMEVFGKKWHNYINKIQTNWNKIVKKNDYIIIPGDISWCTRLSEISEDFKFLDRLNGIKFISKGNHDYWFSTKKKVSIHLMENYNSIKLIERSFHNLDNKLIVTGFKGFNPQVEKKAYEKELKVKSDNIKNQLIEINGHFPNIPIILGYHFPPVFETFHNIFVKYNVKYCLYGHTHINYKQMFNGIKDNIEYHFISADFLQFKPKLILEI